MKILLIIVAVIAALLLISFINHRIRLSAEKKLLAEPIGNLVEVNGYKMNVYTAGSGEKTLVFLSGSGTGSPVLDFKSLYSLLEDDYKIAVVEKSGYGFSDDGDTPRDVDTVLSETREALSKAGLSAPYVLLPHSMSGIESLYWAQKYPDEVTAIIGLDMALPEAYAQMNISRFSLGFVRFQVSSGLVRFYKPDVVKYGTLTDDEKKIYLAMSNSRLMSDPMIEEGLCIKESARKVDDGGVSDVTMLMFCSDGRGTGFNKETWRGIQKNYAEACGGTVIELDCPHYVHAHEYEKIAEETKMFLENIN